MSEFNYIGVVSEKDLPKSNKKDLSDLFLRFEGISHGKALHVQVQTKGMVKSIRGQFYKKFGRSKVHVSTSTNKAKNCVDVYILRKNLGA